MSRIGWWLLGAVTAAYIVVVIAFLSVRDKWTGLALLSLTVFYLGAILILGMSAYVITALVRSKRAAAEAQRAADA